MLDMSSVASTGLSPRRATRSMGWRTVEAFFRRRHQKRLRARRTPKSCDKLCDRPFGAFSHATAHDRQWSRRGTIPRRRKRHPEHLDRASVVRWILYVQRGFTAPFAYDAGATGSRVVSYVAESKRDIRSKKKGVRRLPKRRRRRRNQPWRSQAQLGTEIRPSGVNSC